MVNRRNVVRNQKIALCTLLSVILSIIGSMILFDSIKVEAAAEVSYKYYTSIRIEKGDTLWGIADKYVTDDYKSIDTYLEEIRFINRILGDDIHTGQYLTIPYYSDVYLD